MIRISGIKLKKSFRKQKKEARRAEKKVKIAEAEHTKVQQRFTKSKAKKQAEKDWDQAMALVRKGEMDLDKAMALVGKREKDLDQAMAPVGKRIGELHASEEKVAELSDIEQEQKAHLRENIAYFNSVLDIITNATGIQTHRVPTEQERLLTQAGELKAALVTTASNVTSRGKAFVEHLSDKKRPMIYSPLTINRSLKLKEK